MFPTFFFALREKRVPVSLKEYLTLMEALARDAITPDIDNFYYVSRAVLVKDERYYDRFDQVFAHVFRGALDETLTIELLTADLPAEWLKKLAERYLSEEDKALVESLGGFEKLIETLKERLEKQKGRHQGGSKMIGTAGTSPFGAYGYNPEGVRIGQKESRHKHAVKVWDKREFRNFDDGIELGTRNIKLALRRLRKFARQGAAMELDLPDTIRSTANNAGWLDLKLQRERHNAVKVLLFFDVGGSMDEHIRACEELFSAARSEFKHLEYFYFHNCVYETLWRDNRRRGERVSTWDVIHTYGRDYKLIFVGDASMNPYEITFPGASVEHWNEEAGEVWLKRLLDAYERAVWLNPVAEASWKYTRSIEIVATLMGGRMQPLTLEGLDRGMRSLSA
jgi:uncharacterized protein with von Willebrand factor type A (vWA) domain